MRNRILSRNATTRPNKGTRLNPEEFPDSGIIQGIAIHEMGVEALNDFMGHISQVGGIETRKGKGSNSGIEIINAWAENWKQFAR